MVSALMPLRTRIWETGRNFERCLTASVIAYVLAVWGALSLLVFCVFGFLLFVRNVWNPTLYHAAWTISSLGHVLSFLFDLVQKGLYSGTLEIVRFKTRQHGMRSLVYIYCQWQTAFMEDIIYPPNYLCPHGCSEKTTSREYIFANV